MPSPVDSFSPAHTAPVAATGHAAAESPATMPPSVPANTGVLLLRGIRWDEYLLLRDNPENRHVRMTFKEGSLEFMTLSSFHELISMIIHDFISEWRITKDLPILPTGSMTLRLKGSACGLEGDQSYYIQHQPQVQGRPAIDLDSCPPPDLVIEVEHTNRSINKLELYAAMQVPEVWRWRDETLTVLRQSEGKYEEHPESQSLPGFPLELLRQALSQRHLQNETSLLKNFRQAISTDAQPSTKPLSN